MSMASTSNQVGSSCFPSSSSTPHWNRDVFLSFRGTDTRKNFTSHLYTALKDAGITTFIDDEELPTGREIKPELRKAIRESRMSIIVFSKNYASSRWCLDELLEILECKRTMGQLVLPLYYDVEPSVVRYQTGSFAKAFQHFVAEWDKPKVNNWRAALKEAADLSGHVLANEENGNEARFIEKIVRKVRPVVNLRCLNVPEFLIGVDSHVNCIDMLLSIGSDDVRTIGIYGMGGIGKTTVSKAVYNKHLNHFEGSAFVENIKDVSKLRNGLRRLQKNLLSQLQKNEIKLSNSDEGINYIKKICCSKRVLILLDDLDDLNQVKQLAGQKSWFGTGSRVIMITRDAKLLQEARVDQYHTYEMKVLDEDKSLELFRQHAIGEETLSEDHISVSKDVARYCGGLPLALEVIGSHLRWENLTYWKNALKEFQSKPHKTIQDRLKISYDALRPDRKKIFLDVACLLIGREREDLVKFWDGCGFFAENSIRDLMDKCLLKLDEKNCLWMHDHLRDMGRAIVLEASDSSLEKHSRVWIHEEVRDLLEHQKGTEAVEGIRIDLSNLDYIDLEIKAFEAMHQLRFLLIDDVFRTRFLLINKLHHFNLFPINNVHVTGSFEHLFGKLRWLSWKYCPLKSLPTNFHPRKLVVLDLEYSEIEKLWEGVKHLNNLKILDLSFCVSLVETPNFTGVRSLERLMLTGCQRLSTIDPSICELRSLEELYLKGCLHLSQLPEQLGNMKSLKILNVSRTLLEGLPDSIGQLSRLVHLCLKRCVQLKTLPTTICNLISLEELDVFGCSNLHRFPEQLGDLKCLISLDLRYCGITNLPISMSNLRSLEKCYIDGSSNLRGLPEQLGEMKCLLDLEISHQRNLINLPASICDLRALKKLNFQGCSKLERLPEELGNLECLLALDLSRCENLINLPASTCNLTSLEELNVYGCSNLERLPEGMGNLKRLRTFYASKTKLEELPDSIGHLSSLVHLHLSMCESLKTLPDCICQLSNLTELDLIYCKSLVSLPELHPNLETLNARGCTAMEKIPNLSNLKRLKYLDLSDSNRLVEVQGLENLKLKLLYMAGCNDLAMNTTFNESFFQRCFERGESSILLPKWNFQNWIIYQSMESTISFELPRCLPDNFQGIILWVVYSRFSFVTYGHNADIRNITSGKKRRHFLGDAPCVGGHSWVSRIKSNFGSGDSIKISIEENNGKKVEKCGVHWLIGSEGDEDENVFF